MLIQIIIVVALIGLGYFAYRAWKQQSATAVDGPPDPPRVSEAGIEQVRPGGMIQLPPHGEDMEAADMQITARHRYEEDGFEWFELEGETSAGTTWLDVARDDELETSVVLERLTGADVGLDSETLDAIGEGKTLSYGGRNFAFAERGRAVFHPKGDRGQAETLEYWDFEGEDERHDLGVERWDEQLRVYLSQRIDPARIKIYSLGE